MTFASCPECGVTNHYEKYNRRHFDCGFIGHLNTREARCNRPTTRSGERQYITGALDANSDRYRLGLLDAAHALNVIADDLTTAGAHDPAKRCKELAWQMRGFAGHSDYSPDQSSTSKSGPIRGLLNFLRQGRQY